MGQVNRLRLLSESELLLGASLPVTVDVQQQVGGADGESDSVPEAISQAVGEGLGARLAFEAVVIADLLSHSAALQFKVTAAKKKKKNRSGRQKRLGAQKKHLMKSTVETRAGILYCVCGYSVRPHLTSMYLNTIDKQ